MTSKDYKTLAQKSLGDLSSERASQTKQQITSLKKNGWTAGEAAMIVSIQSEWRRSVFNYELPPDDDTAEHFEIIGSSVVENKTGTVAIAFALAGLDPRNPSHWYDLLNAFTEVHLKRAPKTKKRTKPFFDKLKRRAEEIAGENPGMTRSGVIEVLTSTDHKMTAESTMSGLLSKAKAKGFAKTQKRRFRPE